MSPVLSVVVPAYNAEAYLARALDSLIGLGDDVEVLVVDDGSTDGTAALAQEYVDRAPGLVRLLSKPNGGHGSAINTGLDHARGSAVAVPFGQVIRRDRLFREQHGQAFQQVR